MKLLLSKVLQSSSRKLITILERAIASPTLSFSQICEISDQGLYIIFDENEILYIGKTTRSGKVRMRELASDFRSHTLNKKLLSKHLKDLGFVFQILKNETKKDWIDKGQLTEEDFKAHQKEINQYIKAKVKFKFYKEQDDRKLISLEHFAIAVFNPLHND